MNLTAAQQILVRLYMLGGPEYQAQMVKSGLATGKFTKATDAASAATTRFTRKTWLQNQGLFTARRFAFYATLGFLALGAAVVKLGFDFDNTMQQARVGFRGFLSSSEAVDAELRKLYALAALTPFEFPDIVIATRRILPFAGNVQLANSVVESLLNSLSAVGILTPAALNRASLAMAHMFAIGRLTGQVLYQLGRDNIPMQQALQKQYSATGEQIRAMVSQGLVPANRAAEALANLMQSPGYKGAAFRQATETLYGAFTTFRDILRLAMGGALGGSGGKQGVFGWLQRQLQGIDRAMLPMIQGDRPVTLYMIADAMDKQLSPKTHFLLNLFIFLKSTMYGLVGTIGALIQAVSAILTPFDKLAGVFGANHSAAKILGTALGILLALWIANRGAVIGFHLAAEALTFALWPVGKAIKSLTWLLEANTVAVRINTAANTRAKVVFDSGYASMGRFRQLLVRMRVAYLGAGGGLKGFIAMLVLATSGLWAAASAAWAFAIALLANPITWIVIGFAALILILVNLYMKWKWFHNLVNNTFGWIKENFHYILQLLGPIGWTVEFMIRTWRTWWNVIRKVIDALKEAWNWMRKAGGWLWDKIGIAAHYVNQGLNPAAKMASGGTMTSSGYALVGERGPEMVYLPGGSTVIPNVGSVNPIGSLNMIGSDRPIVVQLVVDRKVLAQQVARANQDYDARR